MDADFSVELGAEDDSLEFPWASPDGALRYLDLRGQPDLLLYVSEANQYPELGKYLEVLNSERSVFLTAKCDVWSETELGEAEAIYEAKVKLGCYIDHLFTELDEEDERRFSFDAHENFAARLVELLNRVPPISLALEAIIRRCYYHVEQGIRSGYYMTFYLFGYGDELEEARKRWGIGLELLQNAMVQLSAELRRGEL